MNLYLRLVLCFFILNSQQLAIANNKSAIDFNSSKKVVAIEEKQQDLELLSYLNDTLLKAGISEDARKYLIELARNNLSNVNVRKLSFAEKTALLKINLYLLLKNLTLTNSTVSSEMYRQYSFAYEHEQPADYLLTLDQLQYLKNEAAFKIVSLKVIEQTLESFCPSWPICKEVKHEHKHKR